jgi:hypothetical protein
MKRSIFIVASLLWSISASAEEECNQSLTGTMDTKTIEELSSRLPICPSEQEADFAEAKKNYELAFPKKDSVRTADVVGLSLEGTREELKIAEQLLGEQPPRSWPDIAKICKTVVCALGKVLGSEEAAMRILAQAKYSGYHISLSQQENDKKIEQIWSASEIRRMDRTIRELPSSFLHIKSLKNIYRMADHYRTHGHSLATGAFANRESGKIVFYDWGINSGLESNLVHEISHHYDYSNGGWLSAYHSDSGYDRISGWGEKKLGRDEKGELEWQYPHRANAPFVRDYAATNPLEDFAESSAYYFAQPNVLKEKDEEKYNFLKTKVFLGREYFPEDRYPELKKVFSSDTNKKVFWECIGKIKDVFMGLSWPTVGKESFPLSRRGDEFIKACAENNINELYLKLQGAENYCELKKKQVIEKTLAQQELNHLITTLEGFSGFFAKDKADFFMKIAADCRKRKEINTKCILKEFSEVDGKAKTALDKFPKEEQDRLVNEVSRMIAANSFYSNPVTKYMLAPVATIIAACALSSDEIRYFKESQTIGYRKKEEQRFSSSILWEFSCRDAAFNYMRSHGYIFDFDSVKDSVYSYQIFSTDRSGILRSFDTTVLVPWFLGIKEKCGKNNQQACGREYLQQLLEDWKRKSGIADENGDFGPAFQQQLFERLRN